MPHQKHTNLCGHFCSHYDHTSAVSWTWWSGSRPRTTCLSPRTSSGWGGAPWESAVGYSYTCIVTIKIGASYDEHYDPFNHSSHALSHHHHYSVQMSQPTTSTCLAMEGTRSTCSGLLLVPTLCALYEERISGLLMWGERPWRGRGGLKSLRRSQ